MTLAALWARREGKDPILVVMPADHVILEGGVFRAAVARAVELAEQGFAVTFGITPDCPETGYGYIQRGAPLSSGDGAYALSRFVEKPDRETAQAYLDQGDYLWNSGIFVMKASIWLSALSMCRPDILDACEKAMAVVDPDLDFIRVDEEAFLACPEESIDYAVMEHIAAGKLDLPLGVVIPLSAGWSDVGAWDALWKVLPKDGDGNVVQGDVFLQGCRNSLVMSGSRLVACIGVDDLIVVETPDALLISHKDKTQEVKQVVDRLKSGGRSEGQLHRKVFRPWGSYDGVDAGERFLVKRIVVNPGACLSLQLHYHRAEHWIVVRGTAKVICEDSSYLVSENQSTFIPLGKKHRLENPGRVPLEMIEVQSGSYLGEDDIVRFEDVYGR